MTALNSPMKVMPDCWNDDVRMNSLFAPFRKRDLNPLAFDSKMMFWKKNIENWCLDHNQCAFNLETIQREFQRNGRTPLCLPMVVDDMLRTGEVKYMHEFVRLPQGTWTSWAIDTVIKTPIIWSFNKLKLTLLPSVETENQELQLVHLSVTKSRAETLLKAVGLESRATLLGIDHVPELVGCPDMDEEDALLVVHWLRHQGLASLTTLNNKILFKLTNAKGQLEPISEADTAILSLRQNELALTDSLLQLEKEKEEAMQEARNYLNKGMRQLAKSSLRKKKELEKCIQKRASALDNVQILLARIREAESNSKVLESYKMGLSALKTTFKEAGLVEDDVTNTMLQVQDMLDVHEEIQASLSEPAGPAVDADLEGELAAILAADSPTKLPDLPSPPQDSPAEAKRKMEKSQVPIIA